MNLNHLAPDIQEELLFLASGSQGRDHLHERMLRPIAAVTGFSASPSYPAVPTVST